MNIAIVLPYLKQRGTEKQSLRISIQLKKRGFNPIIFNIQGWGKFERAFHNYSIPVINVGPPEKINVKQVNSSRTATLTDLIRSYGCRLILSRANLGHESSLIAGKKLKLPVILVFSGAIPKLNGNYATKFLKKLKYSINYRSAKCIVTVSAAGKKNLLDYQLFTKTKVINIPNGVDMKKISSLSSSQPSPAFQTDAFNISYMGSLDIHRKGLDVLFKSVQELSVNNVQLHMIGSGDDLDSLKMMANNLRISDKVFFHGELANPYPTLKKSDLFVLPSRREGMPNSLLEAMSLGICCVATDCETGPSEIIGLNTYGVLVPVGDSSALASSINDLLINDEKRHEYSCKAPTIIKNKFSVEKMGKSYANLINDMIK